MATGLGNQAALQSASIGGDERPSSYNLLYNNTLVFDAAVNNSILWSASESTIGVGDTNGNFFGHL